jgi:mediator of replication checkpoint protein 1
MRKALLADEKVGQIAENPKKAAFFKAIEDRDSDDDVGLDFLDGEPAQDAQEPSSQEGQSETQPKETPPDSETNKRKRPLEPSAEDITNRPPPHLRRKPASAMSKKPANLAEIRETVSFLTETPEYDSFHEAASVDEGADDRVPEEEQPSEHAEEDSEFSRPTHPRRTRGPVIDRLALLRQASSNSANSGSANTRLAFHAGSSSDVGFRPSFARRTTGSSSSSGTTLSTSTTSDNSRRVAKPGASGGVTVKKGSVNFYTAAREREREKELRAKQRPGGSKTAALLNKHASSTLKALGEGRWD